MCVCARACTGLLFSFEHLSPRSLSRAIASLPPPSRPPRPSSTFTCTHPCAISLLHNNTLSLTPLPPPSLSAARCHLISFFPFFFLLLFVICYFITWQSHSLFLLFIFYSQKYSAFT